MQKKREKKMWFLFLLGEKPPEAELPMRHGGAGAPPTAGVASLEAPYLLPFRRARAMEHRCDGGRRPSSP